ncbi:MAG: ABC transporter substrate-binding protein [Nitrososphaerales archaeon]
MHEERSAISRAVIAVVIIVLIVVAGVAAYEVSKSPSSSSTVTTTSSSSSGTGSSTSSSGLPSELVVDEASAPSSMDPGTVIDNNGLEVAQNTNLPLFFCAENNTACTQLVPVVGQTITESADGLTYTVTLRTDVHYSNGDPFNAYVVWYNVFRDLIINQASDFIFYTYFNDTGVTAADLNSFNTATNVPTNQTLLTLMENPHLAVTVMNSSAVQFHLDNAFAPFEFTIDTAPWVFVDPYVVETNGGVVANNPNSWMSVNGTLVGDGPYVTSQYVPNEYTEMVANPNYWAQNLPASQSNYVIAPAKIHEILINYKTDELTRSEDLEGGQSQASIASFDDIPNVLKACGSNCYIPNIGLSGSVEWVAIDELAAPLNNTLVREAIIAAINVTQIQKTVYNGYAVPVVGPNLNGLAFYNDSIKPPAYNVQAAKQLLSQAGYPNGNGLPAINYYYYTSTYQADVAAIIKQDLGAIGITINVHELSQASLIALQGVPGNNATAMQMFSINWTYYPDFSAYEFLVDSALGVYGNMHNQTIVDLIDESNTQLNPTLRGEEISQITQDVQQASAIIWLGQDLDVYDPGAGIGPTIFNHCVTGLWYNTAFNGIDFNSVYYACNP